MGLTRWQRAEVGSGTITTATSATSATGIIAPKKPWPVKFSKLGAWLGTFGPRGTVGGAGSIWIKTESKTELKTSRALHPGQKPSFAIGVFTFSSPFRKCGITPRTRKLSRKTALERLRWDNGFHFFIYQQSGAKLRGLEKHGQ